MLMLSSPTNIDELQARLKQTYNQNTASALLSYFDEQEFDELISIKEDIMDNFDDCCCKETLFKELSITNKIRQEFEHIRLKFCLKPTIMSNKLDEIHKTFTNTFNEDNAIAIAKLFSSVIEQQKFTKNDEIKKDIANTATSKILKYVQANIDYSSFSQKEKNVQKEIANGLQLVFGDKVRQSAKANEEKSNSAHLTPHTESSSTLNVDPFKLKEIERHFTNIFNERSAISICKLFDVAVEANFEDVDEVKDDLEEVAESQIIEHILNNIDYSPFFADEKNVRKDIAKELQSIFWNQSDSKPITKNEPKQSKQPNQPNIPLLTPQKLETRTVAVDTDIKTDIDDDEKEAVSKVMILARRLKEQSKDIYQIGQLFEDFILSEEFDFEAVEADMAEVDDSSILDYIVEKTNAKPAEKGKKMRMFQTFIIAQMKNIQKTPNPMNDLLPIMEYKEENESNIDEIRAIVMRIDQNIKRKFNARIAADVCDKIDAVIKRKKFKHKNILNDIDEEKSELISSLNEINSYRIAPVLKQNTIKQIIIDSCKDPLFDFDVRQFIEDMKYSKKDVVETAEFVTANCNLLYKHFMGVAQQLKSSDFDNQTNESDDDDPEQEEEQKRAAMMGKSRGNKFSVEFESKSLCIVKTIDRMENKPFFYWMFMLFLKERNAQYQNGKKQFNEDYDSNQWFEDNKYCQWIKKIKPKMADHIKAALAELITRLTQPINFNFCLYPVICDKMHAFVRYAIAFHKVAEKIKKTMMKETTNDDDPSRDSKSIASAKLEVAPIQIDYWIIPQMTKKGKNKYYGLTDIGDIRNILEQQLGYAMDKDYDFQRVRGSEEQLVELFYKMIPKNLKYLEACNKSPRRNRYIFIIDRRNEQNVRNNCLKNEAIMKGNPRWQDKIYMIAPKVYQESNGPDKYCQIPKRYDVFPESCLSLSRGFILYNKASKRKLITLNSALDGHMFAFSYHILVQNQINAYFYHNGGTVFDLKDIEWMWPNYFAQIDGNQQRLSSEQRREIAKICDDDALPNRGFEAFERDYKKQFGKTN